MKPSIVFVGEESVGLRFLKSLQAVPTDSPATSEPGSFEPLGEGRYRVAAADRWVEVTGRPRD